MFIINLLNLYAILLSYSSLKTLMITKINDFILYTHDLYAILLFRYMWKSTNIRAVI